MGKTVVTLTFTVGGSVFKSLDPSIAPGDCRNRDRPLAA